MSVLNAMAFNAIFSAEMVDQLIDVVIPPEPLH